MKLSILTPLILLFCLSTVYCQLDIDGNNKVTINSSLVTDSDVSIGVNNSVGGLMINTSDPSYRGRMGYALNGVTKGYSDYDHTKERYNIVVGSTLALGITESETTVFNMLKTQELKLSNKFQVGTDSDPLFTVDVTNQKMFFNCDQVLGDADFVLNTKKEMGFGGMYINSEDTNSGKPFYGYSNGSNISAYHYYDDFDDGWHLYVGKEMLNISENESQFYDDFTVLDFDGATPTFNVKTDIGGVKHMYFNTSSTVALEDFTLNSDNSSGFGGMYVNIDDGTTGKPFYGYALNGNGLVYHYLDATDDYWKLFHTDDDIVEVNDKELVVNGSIRVSNKVGTQPAGTIYYDGFNFYGVKNNGVIRQLDNTTNFNENPNNKSNAQAKIQQLETEKNILAERVKSLESRLVKLESIMHAEEKQ